MRKLGNKSTGMVMVVVMMVGGEQRCPNTYETQIKLSSNVPNVC